MELREELRVETVVRLARQEASLLGDSVYVEQALPVARASGPEYTSYAYCTSPSTRNRAGHSRFRVGLLSAGEVAELGTTRVAKASRKRS